MSTPTASSFVFFTCQPGAEQALKAELAANLPAWRLAFSRPGFVSFKQPDENKSGLTGALPVFARTRSASLGIVSGTTLSSAAEAVWRLEPVKQFISMAPLGGLHVWQRDTQLPGEGGAEPQVTPLALEVRQAILDAFPQDNYTELLRLPASPVAPHDAAVFDVVLVEPNEWYVGWHRAESRVERWPGGLLPIAGPADMISRAYLKMEEALKWSALPAQAGDLWVELGCAPGGASQALLERGFAVLGVDPAEVDEPVASHPRFTHLRKRAAEVRRVEFTGARWLATDINVAPQYTLDAVEEIVKHSSTSIRGLVLTLKLADWSVGAPNKLSEYVERVKSWGYRDVRLKQLAHNRRELCLAALPSRGQRRMMRRRKKKAQTPPPSEVRFDAPLHAVPRHHFR